MDAEDVQGLPRSLVSSLSGLAALLLTAGLLCALQAAWTQFNGWTQLILLLLLPLILFLMHLRHCRRQALPWASLPLAVWMAANLILFPAGVYLAIEVAPLLGALCALLYALALLWYGASYRLPMALSAACALAFAAAMSIPTSYGPGAVLSAALLILLGLMVLGVAIWLHRKRQAKLVQLKLALRRQELDRADRIKPPTEEES